MMRRGIEAILGEASGVEVCGEAGDAEVAILLATRLQPDVVVMALRLEGASGVTATRELCRANLDRRVLLVADGDDGESLVSAIAAGAAGFVDKRASAADLVQAVREVAAGRNILGSTATSALIERVRNRPFPRDERLARLSPRELEVLTLVADGLSNADIAERRSMSEKTVKNHLTRVFSKLEVARRSEAAAYFLRHDGAGG